MRAMLVVTTLLLLAAASAAVPAQPLTREQAVRQLAQADVEARRVAIDRLAEVGAMSDVTPLLAELRDPDEDARRKAEQAIWQIWSRSGDEEVDALYRTGVGQMESGDLQEAIATFSRVIERKPDFAEGWNKRATLYFLVGDLRRSLVDCDEVVKRNPNHFGALSGYVQIYARLEYYERALDYARRALAINPNLDGIREAIPLLERRIGERKKQAT